MTEHEDLIDWGRESAPGDSPTELAIRVHRLADALEKVTAERAALSAVVEQVREILGPNEHGRVSVNEEKVWLAVHAAPSVALDRVKAEAWDEGAATGAEVGMAAISLNPMHANPYRKDESNE